MHSNLQLSHGQLLCSRLDRLLINEWAACEHSTICGFFIMHLLWRPPQVFIRVVRVLNVANKSSWRICETHDIKWSVSDRFLPHSLSAPPGSAVERHGTLTIFPSTSTKNYPILRHCLRRMSSTNTFNEAQWAMAAEQTEDVSFSFLDNAVSRKPRTYCPTASD
jgi:hypothetical protein